MATLGYCCINQTLRNKKPVKESVYCGRSLIKRTFTLEEASRRALANCRDLLTILRWNEAHNIKCMRISSDLFPRYTCGDCGYDYKDMPDIGDIMEALIAVGDYAVEHNHHLSFHPGPYTTLASPTERSMLNGVSEFQYHCMLATFIDSRKRLDIPINIHIGGSYGGEYEATAKRFVDTCQRYLAPTELARMVIENDDKASGWSVKRLYDMITWELGTPITFDIHHHQFCADGLSTEEAFKLARSTWNGRNMQVHYSQSPTADKLIPKHSDYYRDPIPQYIMDDDNVHVHLEAKGKELALLDYVDKFC